MGTKRESMTTAVGVGDKAEPPQREYWSSRLAFYFAASGAAIGFGNVWRFPGLSVKYGGGAFFVPYLFALFAIGIPLTVLEIGFGQFFQTGDIGVFGTLNDIISRTFRNRNAIIDHVRIEMILLGKARISIVNITNNLFFILCI